MTKQELIAKLKHIEENEGYGIGQIDPEEGHSQAEKLLLSFIKDQEIAEAFNAIQKYYA